MRTCGDWVRGAFEIEPEAVLSANDLCRLLEGKWSRNTVKEQIRILATNNVITFVRFGGNNKREKFYQLTERAEEDDTK